ncbi:MAG: hypothetical protein OEM40_04335, partial [Acidimicrobiia bacterium]|nr:hypothetical protein [Acidimicrobiia bacterium]
DATPNKAGPVDQARPLGAQWSNQAAAFDAAMGRVVFLDGSGETWTFDVCTNTWQLMNPEYRIESGLVSPDDPDGWLGQLVYDVDSDRTIAFRGNSVAVYDSQTNTWTLRVQPSEYDTGIPGSGAIYHPGSGLVVVQTGESGLVAYDVDTNTWTPIGQVEWTEQVPPYLVGYQPETEQLVFLGGFDERGMLVDAQSGEVNESAPLEGGVFAGFGRFDFATGGDSAHVVRPLDGNGGDVCRLDPTNLAWECISMTNGPTGFGQGPGLLSASVYDPINSRIVLLYGYADGFNGQRFHEVNDIWAVDISAGQWAQLLERSGEMTYEEETPES